MTPLAIIFMVVAMLVIWGGLAVAVTFLARNPLPPEEDDAGPGAPGGTASARSPHPRR